MLLLLLTGYIHIGTADRGDFSESIANNAILKLGSANGHSISNIHYR